MDWSHLEMPFVLSLFPSFYSIFTLRLLVCCQSALCCVFIIFPLWLGDEEILFFVGIEHGNED